MRLLCACVRVASDLPATQSMPFLAAALLCVCRLQEQAPLEKRHSSVPSATEHRASNAALLLDDEDEEEEEAGLGPSAGWCGGGGGGGVGPFAVGGLQQDDEDAGAGLLGLQQGDSRSPGASPSPAAVPGVQAPASDDEAVLNPGYMHSHSPAAASPSSRHSPKPPSLPVSQPEPPPVVQRMRSHNRIFMKGARRRKPGGGSSAVLQARIGALDPVSMAIGQSLPGDLRSWGVGQGAGSGPAMSLELEPADAQAAQAVHRMVPGVQAQVVAGFILHQHLDACGRWVSSAGGISVQQQERDVVACQKHADSVLPRLRNMGGPTSCCRAGVPPAYALVHCQESRASALTSPVNFGMQHCHNEF